MYHKISLCNIFCITKWSFALFHQSCTTAIEVKCKGSLHKLQKQLIDKTSIENHSIHNVNQERMRFEQSNIKIVRMR